MKQKENSKESTLEKIMNDKNSAKIINTVQRWNARLKKKKKNFEEKRQRMSWSEREMESVREIKNYEEMHICRRCNYLVFNPKKTIWKLNISNGALVWIHETLVHHTSLYVDAMWSQRITTNNNQRTNEKNEWKKK